MHFNSLSQGFIVICDLSFTSIFIIAMNRGIEDVFIDFLDDPNLERVTWWTEK